MKLLQVVLFILCTLSVSAQDIKREQDIQYRLAHTGNRKWIGVNKTKTLSGPSSTNLVFFANHKVEAQYVNSPKYNTTKNWLLINGTNIDDDNIQLQIGGITYTVIFTKTANGSDFMTLTYYKNEKAISRSYYSE